MVCQSKEVHVTMLNLKSWL